jgi:hypothetical protein
MLKLFLYEVTPHQKATNISLHFYNVSTILFLDNPYTFYLFRTSALISFFLLETRTHGGGSGVAPAARLLRLPFQLLSHDGT